ncbi:MAG: helix-turn-helix domain-containing protein [Chloroflexi bacterium]|nr:helix-turn-helix domain-containing protein [Chloroflexota bacterium]
MTETERADVQRMAQQGLGVREIARRFGRAPSTISRILRDLGGPGGRAAARPTRRAPARATRPTTTTTARARAATPMGAGISRQELRSLEQRITRIESNLSRMASVFQPTRGGARKH